MQRKLLRYYKMLKDFEGTEADAAVFYARKLAEGIGIEVFRKQEVKYDYSKLMINEIMQLNGRLKIIPTLQMNQLETIRRYGNQGIHYQIDDEPLKVEDILPATSAATALFEWFLVTYCHSSLTSEMEIDRMTVVLSEPKNACLYWMSSDHEVIEVIDLNKNPFIIGRSKDCDHINDNEHFSRVHCKIVIMDGGYYLEDPGSRNGVKVNGVRLSAGQKVALNNEALIDIVGVKYRFMEV